MYKRQVAAAAALSAGYVALLARRARAVIVAAFYFKIGLAALFALACLASGNLFGALVGALAAAALGCVLRCWRDAIPFAAANLRCAAAAASEHAAIFLVALGGVAVSLVFVPAWFYGALGALDASAPAGCDGLSDDAAEQCGGNAGVGLWLLLTLVWTLQFVRYTTHVTSAGVVASWWFGAAPGAGVAGGVVAGALLRALTSSAGTAALAALVIAVLEVLRFLAHQAARRRGRDHCAVQLAGCVLGCLESLAEYFNKWALTYAGVYGDSLVEAGRAVAALFERRGFDALVNDSIVDSALALAGALVGVLTALVAALLAAAAGHSGGVVALVALVALIAGFYVCSVAVGVVSAGVATVYVCFAEDPAALAATHPAEHDALVEAWRVKYPDLVVAMSI